MIHIIRHKEYDFEIPSGYCTCEACIYHGYCDREDMREPKGEKGD